MSQTNPAPPDETPEQFVRRLVYRAEMLADRHPSWGTCYVVAIETRGRVGADLCDVCRTEAGAWQSVAIALGYQEKSS